jgi:long-chain acyl-CoA synthetase
MGSSVVPLYVRAGDEPGGVAIHAPSGDVTWSEAARVVGRIATRLRGLDLGPARRIAVFAGNRPATVVAHAGALLADTSAVAVSAALTAPEVAYQLHEADARVIFVDPSTEAVAREAAAGRSQITVVALPASGASGPALGAWAGDDARKPEPTDGVRPNLLFTSGTTGRPKAVQLPPAIFGGAGDLAGFVANVQHSRMAGIGTHLVAGPLHHNGPLTAVRLLLAGERLVVPPRFDAPEVLAAIGRFRVASSVMVPTHFARLLALPAEVRAAADVSSLRCVVHTGAACPVEVKRAILDWWGLVLHESYGGTESGTTCSIGPEDWLAHPGSVGRPVPPFEAVIVDDDGRLLPVGEEGRLYFRDTTGRGIRYEGDDEKTAAAHLAPGVFTLGEIGRIDDDGFVYITDRFSDMVVSGGVNVYPAEAEQALVEHPSVADAAAFGVPDPDLGEHLEAAVQLNAGADFDEAALIAFCKERLAGYKVPKAIHVVDDLARNPMGKLDKRAIRADIATPTA